MALLSIEADAKTRKGSALGVLTGVLYMAPSDVSGFNVCPMALRTGDTPDGVRSQCSRSCLFTAGRGAFANVRDARIARTRLYFEDRDAFMAQLRREIAALVRKAQRMGMVPAVRLDGTSDLGIARDLAPEFPDVRFYDYTKVLKRALATDRPANWHVTYSASEVTDDATVLRATALGVNVSMVFDVPKGRDLPAYYLGRPVIDGDVSDVRFYDPAGVIVGLRAKGAARKDRTGFVRSIPIVPLAAA